MKKILLVLCVVSSALCGQAASANLHWKGPDGVFEAMSSWSENNKVPTAEDFIIVKNYSGANWSVSFTNDETSWKSELGTPLTNSETVFKLNGHAWTLALDIHMGELTSGGGRIVFTNGTLRAPSLSFVPSVTNNLVLSMNNVTCEVGTTEYGSTRATFEGGSLRVTNALSVGKPGFRAATVIFDKGVMVSVTNNLIVGDAAGATGEIVNINGQLERAGSNGTFVIGNYGCGALTIQGGTTAFGDTVTVGNQGTGVGFLTLLGGVNIFKQITLAGSGKGTLLVGGGTNDVTSFSVGAGNVGLGSMTLTNGLFRLSDNAWIGYNGKGSLTVSGGVMRTSAGTLCVGRLSGGTGEVTVAGGVLDVIGEFRLGGNLGSQGHLTLSGDGLMKVGYISEYTSDADSTILFDGGTLQARQGGALIRSVDDIRLTTNGLVLDTAGYAVSVLPALQNASGVAGGITKKGAGTLTLAGARTATGPVSVLGGTLVMSNTVVVSAGTSRIDGTLALTADNRLTVGTGAALAGTGTVARVTLQDNAVFARDKEDGAVMPLAVSDCVASDRMTVALTGYTLGELKTTLPLIRMPTTAIDTGKVTVTLNGQMNAFLFVKYVADGVQQVLSVSYSAGTMVLVR